jgi:hypothetical protein
VKQFGRRAALLPLGRTASLPQRSALLSRSGTVDSLRRIIVLDFRAGANQAPS